MEYFLENHLVQVRGIQNQQFQSYVQKKVGMAFFWKKKFLRFLKQFCSKKRLLFLLNFPENNFKKVRGIQVQQFLNYAKKLCGFFTPNQRQEVLPLSFFKLKWPQSLLKVKLHLINDQKQYFIFLQFSLIAGQEIKKI